MTNIRAVVNTLAMLLLVGVRLINTLDRALVNAPRVVSARGAILNNGSSPNIDTCANTPDPLPTAQRGDLLPDHIGAATLEHPAETGPGRVILERVLDVCPRPPRPRPVETVTESDTHHLAAGGMGARWGVSLTD